MTRRMPTGIGEHLLHILLLLGAFVMLLPFAWMVSTSLKTLTQALLFPPIWIPTPLQWQNYVQAFTEHGIGQALFNSVVVSTSIVLGQLATASLAAYVFSRLRFWGRDLLLLLFLATMMVPFHVYVIPLYTLFRSVGWLNTYQALIVPDTVTPFGIFLLRQFFMTLPIELEEAVLVDGGGRLRAFWSVILPLAKPALATLGIFSFVGAWNELLWPLVALSRSELYTLPIALSLFAGEFITLVQYQMAGATIATIPVMILFLAMQKHFVRGIVMSGLKA